MRKVVILMFFGLGSIISTSAYALTASCDHGGGYFPWEQAKSFYSASDYFLGGQHMIYGELDDASAVWWDAQDINALGRSTRATNGQRSSAPTGANRLRASFRPDAI